MLCPVRTDGCRAVSSHRCQHKPASPVVLWPGGQKGDLGMRKFTETSSFTNPTTTPGKGFAKGCCCIPGSPRSLPFLKGIQVSLYIIPALFKTRFYHIKEKNNHWKKDPPGERGAGSPGKTLLQRETSYRATNSLREQERTWVTGNMRARKKGVYG